MTILSKKASERKPSIRRRQKAFLEAYDKSLSNISVACKQIGISRNTFYDWCKKYPDFNEKINEFDEGILDFAETMLMKNIREQKEASIFFFLKTKGKSRGYIEKQELEHSGNDPFLEAMQLASKVRRQEQPNE